MKKLITILFFMAFVIGISNAQHVCTPTQTGPVPNPGALIPQSLPDGIEGCPYNEILQLGFRDSVTAMGMNVFITSVKLKAMVGVPAGLTAYCANGGVAPCDTMVPGNWYCYTLNGTPTTASAGAADSINASIEARISLTRGGATMLYTTTASAIFGAKIPIKIYPAGTYPGAAASPTGAVTVCNNETATPYTTPGAGIASSYVWELNPPSAGVITGTGTSVTIAWAGGFTGAASLTVKGHNCTGDGPVSAALNVAVQNCTGINDLNGVSMKLYPNPGNGQFNLQLNSSQPDVISIKVYDAIGILVYSRLNVETTSQFNTSLNLQDLPVGMYYVEVNGTQINKVNRVMIQK
jgi:hypothetical protein